MSELEQLLEDKLQEAKERLSAITKEAIQDVYCDILPHLETDLFMNDQFQAQRVLEKILSGDFTREGDYVKVKGNEGISVRCKMTTSRYDKLRQSLLEIMPECPKDLEIQRLEEEISDFYSRDMY